MFFTWLELPFIANSLPLWWSLKAFSSGIYMSHKLFSSVMGHDFPTLRGKPSVSHKPRCPRKKRVRAPKEAGLACFWWPRSNRSVSTGTAAAGGNRCSFPQVLASSHSFKELPTPAFSCFMAAAGGFQSAEEREKKTT